MLPVVDEIALVRWPLPLVPRSFRCCCARRPLLDAHKSVVVLVVMTKIATDKESQVVGLFFWLFSIYLVQHIPAWNCTWSVVSSSALLRKCCARNYYWCDQSMQNTADNYIMSKKNVIIRIVDLLRFKHDYQPTVCAYYSPLGNTACVVFISKPIDFCTNPYMHVVLQQYCVLYTFCIPCKYHVYNVH